MQDTAKNRNADTDEQISAWGVENYIFEIVKKATGSLRKAIAVRTAVANRVEHSRSPAVPGGRANVTSWRGACVGDLHCSLECA